MKMLTRRLLTFIPSLAVTCWLGMQLVHETGHMLAALLSGGVVKTLVFHPLAFSRTDVDPNPHPIIIAWSGALFGTLFPLALAFLLRAMKRRSYLADFFAAFCLLVNGAYLSLGSFERFGDAGDLLRLQCPPWTLWLFGAISCSLSLTLFHQQGRLLGLPQRIAKPDLWLAPLLASLLLLTGLIIDGR